MDPMGSGQWQFPSGNFHVVGGDVEFASIVEALWNRIHLSGLLPL